MALHPTVGGFSTILQLSVGANLTFATILSLFDNLLGRERIATEHLVKQARLIKNDPLYASRYTTTHEAALADSRQLKLDVDQFSSMMERITYHWFRPVAITCAMLAFAMLIYSTFVVEEFSNLFFRIAALVTIFPLILFAVSAVIVTGRYMRESQRRRNRIDNVFVALIDGVDTNKILPAE